MIMIRPTKNLYCEEAFSADEAIYFLDEDCFVPRNNDLSIITTV